MDRPKIEDFKPEYTKGVAEIASVAKQYIKAQEEYIDYLEETVKNCSIPDVVGRSEQLPCDCNVKLAETTLQIYCPKCYKTHKMK